MRKDVVIKFLHVEGNKFVVEITDDNDTRIYKIPINGEIRIKQYLETGIEVDT